MNSAASRPSEAFANSPMHNAGRAALLDGSHRVEVMPEPGGRWGTSMILRPSGDLESWLANETQTLSTLLEGPHWLSAAPGRAHITVRALEHREAGITSSERVDRYGAALGRAAAHSGPITLVFDRVELSVGAVVAVGQSSDGSGGSLRDALERELAEDGWLERKYLPEGRGELWYCSLVHYAAPVTDPRSLVQWVETREKMKPLQATFSQFEVCSYSFDGRGMTAATIASVPAG